MPTVIKLAITVAAETLRRRAVGHNLVWAAQALRPLMMIRLVVRYLLRVRVSE